MLLYIPRHVLGEVEKHLQAYPVLARGTDLTAHFGKHEHLDLRGFRRPTRTGGRG